MGKVQLLSIAALIMGVVMLTLIYYITISPLMLWAFGAAAIAFGCTIILALNPALASIILANIFGPVRLPEGKMLRTDRGILLAKFEGFWYASAYVLIHVVKPFTSRETEPENYHNIAKRSMTLFNALASLQRPLEFKLVLAPVPKAKQKLEEALESAALERLLPTDRGGLFYGPWRKAKAMLKYEMLKELAQRVWRDEQIFDAFRAVRVTARGTTIKEAIERCEALAEKVAGIVVGAIPNARAERAVGEDFVRLVMMDYGYLPVSYEEFREDYGNILAKQARAPF